MEEKKQGMSSPQNDPGEKRSNMRLIALVAILAVEILAAAVFLIWRKVDEKQGQMAALEARLAAAERSAPKNSAAAPASSQNSQQNVPAQESKGNAADDYPEGYKGWETYENFEMGYKLRYPATWKIRERSGASLMGDPMNYIFIDSPNKLTLQWGLRNKDEKIRLSERTGIGAGKMVPDGHITILGNEVPVNLFEYDGKADEILYPNTGISEIDGGKREMLADFSIGADSADVDLKKIPERYVAEKILKSIRLIERKKATCAGSLTDANLEEMENWNTFTNPKYHLAFRYPQSWEMSSDSSQDYVSSEQNVFQFRSGPMSATDFMGYEEQSKTNSDIACQKATRTFLCGDPKADPPIAASRCMTMAQLEKDGVPHLITYSFKSMGASLSGVYTDTFDLILKSLKFY